MDIYHFYRTGDMDDDVDHHSKRVVEGMRLLRRRWGDDYELGTIFQPEGARVSALPPGLGPGTYIYTDHLVPGWKPDKSVGWIAQSLN